MKTEFKAKFLQQFVQKRNSEKGFTLIELLVVIIIIGILSAIALPSFLNQANKARQSEAQTYIGSINRGQQAHFLERNRFASNLQGLELGISNSANYTYATGVSITAAGTNASVISTAAPAGVLKGYAGRVFIGIGGADNTATTLAVLCEGTAGAFPNVAAVTAQTSCPVPTAAAGT